MTSLNTAAARLKLVAMDVDGVLTNGTVTYDSNGLEHKSFCIKYGLGIKLLQKAGLRVALITGRSSAMVERRAAELGITDLIQGREDKLTALQEMVALMGCTLEDAAYMGDDLPDLAAIKGAAVGVVAFTCNPWGRVARGETPDLARARLGEEVPPEGERALIFWSRGVRGRHAP